MAAPSLGEILEGAPGVTTRSFGSAPARPVIRGFDGDRVLVILIGERLGVLSSTAVDHAVGLDPLSMNRVEVVRGPASLLYGSSAIGGVVNMFSNDIPNEWDAAGVTGTAATQASSMNNMGAGMLRVQHGDDHFAATGRMIYRQGGDLRTPDGRLPDTALENLSYGAGVSYRTGSGAFESGFSVSGMDYDYGLPEAIDTNDESIEIRMNRINLQSVSTLKTDRFFELIEVRLQYSDYYHEEIAASRVQANQVFESRDITFEQESLSSSLLLRHRQTGILKGALGFSFNFNSLNVGGGDALTPNADGYFLAGYLYEEFQLSDILSLKAGARMEWKEAFVRENELFTDTETFSDRNDLIFSGAMGLNVSPGEHWTAGLQVARAFRTPTIEELYSFAEHAAAGSFDVGNPNLDNEISLGTDLFLRYNRSRLQGEVSLFLNSIDNFVDFTPTGDIHEPSRLPIFEYQSKDAILWGFEYETDVVITRNFMIGAGIDYVRGRERSVEQNNLTFMPPLRTKLKAMYDTGDFWIGPRVTIVNKQDKVAPNEDPTDGYWLLSLGAGYRFDQAVTLSLRANNLLNRSYRDHLSRVENRDAPMPGRHVNVMLRWEF
jgi:iron complex outermembrane receptor protein